MEQITPKYLHLFEVCSRSGLLSLGNVDVLGQGTLCCTDSPVYCMEFSSVPGRYRLEANIPSVQL